MLTKLYADGRVTSSTPVGLARSPDGSFVAVGWAGQPDYAKESAWGCDGCRFALARYGRNGGPDRGFGTDGTVQTAVGGRTNLTDFARAVAVEPNGDIVVVGDLHSGYYDNGLVPVGLWSALAVLRYHPDGSLDGTFGAAGTVTTVVGSSEVAFANAVAFQPDGKIVVAGDAYYGNDPHVFLIRYQPDGQRDRSFGTDGVVEGPTGSASALVLQPDGKIVVGGASIDGRIQLARYRSDGSPDPTFGANGVVTTALGQYSWVSALALQPNGAIVAVGGSEQNGEEIALARYRPDGTLDTSFGRNGTVLTESGAYSRANDLALQPDGKIVVAAFSAGDGTPATLFTVLRYTAHGTLDRSFGPHGEVDTASSNGSVADALVLQPDQKIVVAGLTTPGSAEGAPSDFTLVRLLGDSRCVVPRVVGQSERRARIEIARANCSLAPVRRVFSRAFASGRVIAQRPSPGSSHPGQWRVTLTVSKGARAK